MKWLFPQVWQRESQMNFNDPSFWVFVSFFVLFLLLGKKVWVLVTQALDGRSKEIEEKINEASRMREEALALLNTCKRQQIEASEQAAGILTHAEEEAERLRQKALEDTTLFIETEERLFQERLLRAEQSALEEIKEKAILVASDAVRDILRNHQSLENEKVYFDSFCKELGSYEIDSKSPSAN